MALLALKESSKYWTCFYLVKATLVSPNLILHIDHFWGSLLPHDLWYLLCTYGMHVCTKGTRQAELAVVPAEAHSGA